MGKVIRAARSFAAGDAAEATAVLLSVDGGGGEEIAGQAAIRSITDRAETTDQILSTKETRVD
jgi:hypothetical protein